MIITYLPMPYRRLPNTDQTRLKALQTAIQRASEADFNEQVLSYHTQSEARNFLLRFESVVSRYHDNFRTRVSSNKDYRHIIQNARMYISHFIQVLNLTVIRGEIKKQLKELYHLDPDSHILPDLSSEEDLLSDAEPEYPKGKSLLRHLQGTPSGPRHSQENREPHNRRFGQPPRRSRPHHIGHLEPSGYLLQGFASIRPYACMPRLWGNLLLPQPRKTSVRRDGQTSAKRARCATVHTMERRIKVILLSCWE